MREKGTENLEKYKLICSTTEHKKKIHDNGPVLLAKINVHYPLFRWQGNSQCIWKSLSSEMLKLLDFGCSAG